MRISGYSLSALLVTLFLAGGATAQDDSLEACRDAGVLEACPASCTPVCRGAFYKDNKDLCQAAFLAEPDSDPANCIASASKVDGPVVVQSDLGACIAEKGAIEMDPPPFFDGDEKLLALWDEMFSDEPACAASVLALTEMYSCLQDDAEKISAAYVKLGGLDVEPSKVPEDELQELSCSLSTDRLRQIKVGSDDLSGKAEGLRDQVRDVAVCRSKYAEWLDSRGSICERGDFPACETVLSRYNNEIAKRLKSAKERDAAIGQVLENLQNDQSTIQTVGFLTAFCPR